MSPKQLLMVGLLCAACGAPPDDQRTKIAQDMHDALQADLVALHQAAIDIQTAAPVGHGWSTGQDAAAIVTMKEAWKRARTAYEHIEGALAPIFIDLDAAVDERYDGFLEGLATQGGDQNLFDDEGVTGMHGIERILFSDETPMRVVQKEKTLVGYQEAAFPANATEAADFKNKLCAKLISDTQLLKDQWQPQNIDLAGAYQGLIDLMLEQQEKVNNASLGTEESRYAQRTLVDLRDNLAGTQKIYRLFQSWLKTKKDAKYDGASIDSQIIVGFSGLETIYNGISGDALPVAPETWSAETPTAQDLDTPFGRLYSAVQQATDQNRDGSIAHEMNEAAVLLGFQNGE